MSTGKGFRISRGDLDAKTLPVVALEGMFAEYNPRKMSDHDFAVLRRSLEKFELVQPIVVNKRTPEKGWPRDVDPAVVGGHQRIRAASDLGLDMLEVHWVDLDRTSEQELNVVMNRNSGDWDSEMLEDLLRQIDAKGGDLAMTGFTEEELSEWLNLADHKPDGGDGAPSLDKRNEVQCPACGHLFHPEAAWRKDEKPEA